MVTLATLADDMVLLTKRVEALIERCVVLNDELWNWAQYRAKQLGKESVSQYLFDLIREDKKKTK